MIKALSQINDAPKAVIFDIDNTIYPYGPSHSSAENAVISKMLKIYNIPKDYINNALEDAKESLKKQLGPVASSHSRLLYFQLMLENLGLKSSISLALDLEQTYWRTFLVSASLFTGVKEFLNEIKSHGLALGAVTDLTSQIQFRKIIYFGLENQFDYIVTSEESGKDKPSKDSFIKIMKKMNLDPSECWMIGDHPLNDIQGGKELGMRTFQIAHPFNQMKPIKEYTDVIFESYAELQQFFLEVCNED